jgi:hypothetical protein
LVPVVGSSVWYCSVLGWLPQLVPTMRTPGTAATAR